MPASLALHPLLPSPPDLERPLQRPGQDHQGQRVLLGALPSSAEPEAFSRPCLSLWAVPGLCACLRRGRVLRKSTPSLHLSPLPSSCSGTGSGQFHPRLHSQPSPKWHLISPRFSTNEAFFFSLFSEATMLDSHLTTFSLSECILPDLSGPYCSSQDPPSTPCSQLEGEECERTSFGKASCMRDPPPLISFATLSKSPHLSDSQFPHL